MMSLLFFWLSFILVLSVEWVVGRFFAPFDVAPPLAASFTVIWGASHPLFPKLWRFASVGILMDSISSLPFGSYTIALALAGLTTWFLHFILSNPRGLIKKNMIAAAGLLTFIISIFVISPLLTYAESWRFTIPALAPVRVFITGILWALLLPAVFNILLYFVPKRLRS